MIDVAAPATPAVVAEADHQRPDVLVTGAGGFIGRHLVARLVREGHSVRALVRRAPPAAWSSETRVEVMHGDLADPAAVDRAVAGARLVYHVGATTRGSPEDFDRGTIAGTRHVVDSVLTHAVPRLVYVSSLSVLHAAAALEGQVITETWPLEPKPDQRGHYTRSKLAAEQYVSEAARTRGLPVVILRPAEIIGPGATFLTSGVAQRAGRTLVVLGNGRVAVPLVALDDLLDALVLAGEHGPFDGTIAQLVDPAVISQNELIDRYRAAAGGTWRVVHVPRPVAWLAGATAETVLGLAGRAAPLSRYRLQSALAPRAFDCSQARRLWGWAPRTGVAAVLDQLAQDLKR